MTLTVRPAYAVALGLALLFGALHVLNTQPEDTTTARSRALLTLAGHYTALRDSVQRVERRYAVLLDRETALEGAAKGQSATDSTALAQSHTAQDSLQQALHVIYDLRVALASCDSAGTILGGIASACNQLTDSLATRIDTLTAALGRQVQVGTPRCAWGLGAGVSANSPHLDVVLGYVCRI